MVAWEKEEAVYIDSRGRGPGGNGRKSGHGYRGQKSFHEKVDKFKTSSPACAGLACF